jgi:F0F1-type ATP synthase membrane subunit a
MKMITNLFSIFDPSSAYIRISWTTIFLPIIIILTKTSKLSRRTTAIVEKIKRTIETETKHLITKRKKGTTKIITTIFITLIIMNIIALIPQTFAKTTRLDINLVLAIIM